MTQHQVIDLCGQELCMEDATCSFVWPGRPRAFACRKHADKVMGVALALGLGLESLDFRSVKREPLP